MPTYWKHHTVPVIEEPCAFADSERPLPHEKAITTLGGICYDIYSLRLLRTAWQELRAASNSRQRSAPTCGFLPQKSHPASPETPRVWHDACAGDGVGIGTPPCVPLAGASRAVQR